MALMNVCPWSVRSYAWVGTAVLLALAGCGGRPPASASDLPGSGFVQAAHLTGDNVTSVVVRSGLDGQPLAGALVDVLGTTMTSDSQGRVQGTFPLGAPLRVSAEGALVRQTVAGPEDELALWPEGVAVPRDDTFDLVYRDSPSQQLTRVQAGNVALRLSPAVAADPVARATINEAAARMSEASGVVYRVDPSPRRGDVVFDVIVDAGLPPDVLGHTVVRSRSGVVTGGQISFHSLTSARRLNTTLHELAHSYGLLGHSADPRNVLFASASEVTEFSPVERAILTMMRQRRPGNRFPDTDAGLGAVSATMDVTHATVGAAAR